MAAGGDGRGPLWVDGRMTLRVRGPGPEPGRVVRVRRPFALIGRLPGSDVRIDDAAVDPRHAFLLLDRRGLFGVDLLTATGTRFAGGAAGSARLGAGDVLEVAGRRVEVLQLRVDNAPLDGPLADDDLLADADPTTLASLTLEPLDAPGPPWMLGSPLAFVGRGEACAIRVEGASASRTHCALLRDAGGAYVIDLLGRLTLVNDRPIGGASALLDGDVLTIGQARFAVRVEPPRARPSAPAGIQLPATLPAAGADPGGRMALLLAGTTLEARDDVIAVLRSFQADAATLFEAQFDRLESLTREIAALREEIRGRGGPPPPAEPLRLDFASVAPADPERSAAWLLERFNGLETESRSTWKDLMGRIASVVRPRGLAESPPADES